MMPGKTDGRSSPNSKSDGETRGHSSHRMLDPRTAGQRLQLGAADYVLKPILGDSLLNSLNRSTRIASSRGSCRRRRSGFPSNDGEALPESTRLQARAFHAAKTLERAYPPCAGCRYLDLFMPTWTASDFWSACGKTLAFGTYRWSWSAARISRRISARADRFRTSSHFQERLNEAELFETIQRRSTAYAYRLAAWLDRRDNDLCREVLIAGTSRRIILPQPMPALRQSVAVRRVWLPSAGRVLPIDGSCRPFDLWRYRELLPVRNPNASLASAKAAHRCSRAQSRHHAGNAQPLHQG